MQVPRPLFTMSTAVAVALLVASGGGAQLGLPSAAAPEAASIQQEPDDLPRFAQSGQDERSCIWMHGSCDCDYVAELNRRSSGSVGWAQAIDGTVILDPVDIVQLPAVPGSVTVFIKNNADSQDVLQVLLEDRSGATLHAPAQLGVGATMSISWTRTDEALDSPYQLRLSARTGPGDHSVNYTVLPVAGDTSLAEAAQRHTAGRT